MWQHNYTPLYGSLAWSAFGAGFPIFVLLVMIAVLRKGAWVWSLAGLAAAALVALFINGMPVGIMLSSVAFGAASGLFPIGWVVVTAIFLFNITAGVRQYVV